MNSCLDLSMALVGEKTKLGTRTILYPEKVRMNRKYINYYGCRYLRKTDWHYHVVYIVRFHSENMVELHSYSTDERFLAEVDDAEFKLTEKI